MACLKANLACVTLVRSSIGDTNQLSEAQEEEPLKAEAFIPYLLSCTQTSLDNSAGRFTLLIVNLPCPVVKAST